MLPKSVHLVGPDGQLTGERQHGYLREKVRACSSAHASAATTRVGLSQSSTQGGWRVLLSFQGKTERGGLYVDEAEARAAALALYERLVAKAVGAVDPEEDSDDERQAELLPLQRWHLAEPDSRLGAARTKQQRPVRSRTGATPSLPCCTACTGPARSRAATAGLQKPEAQAGTRRTSTSPFRQG